MRCKSDLALLIAITAVWLIAGLATIHAEDGSKAQPELLIEGGYEDCVHSLFDKAQKEITVIMYLAVLPGDARPSHPVRRLLDHLIAVHKRGVVVQAIFDAGAPPESGRPSEAAATYLAAAGVPVRWDEDTRTTHIKAIIVDGRWSVIGSTNWTFSAMRSNRETSVCCDNAALAAKLQGIFAEAWSKGRALP